MKILILFGLLTIVSIKSRVCGWCALRDGPYQVGPLLDQFLEVVNRDITLTNQTTFRLNDFSVAGATGKNVYLNGLNTIVRRGDASVANQNNIFLANATLGLTKCRVYVKEFSYHGKRAPVVFDIQDNSVLIGYSVDIGNKINCTLNWNKFQLVTLNNVTTHSSDRAFNDEDVSGIFNTVFFKKLNEHFASKKFLKFLDDHVNPCLHKGSYNPIAELRSLVNVYNPF